MCCGKGALQTTAHVVVCFALYGLLQYGNHRRAGCLENGIRRGFAHIGIRVEKGHAADHATQLAAQFVVCFDLLDLALTNLAEDLTRQRIDNGKAALNLVSKDGTVVDLHTIEAPIQHRLQDVASALIAASGKRLDGDYLICQTFRGEAVDALFYRGSIGCTHEKESQKTR